MRPCHSQQGSSTGWLKMALRFVSLLRCLLWFLHSAVSCTCVLQLILVSGANRALGLSDELFVLGDSVILTVLGQVSHHYSWR
jgi:hypothetical protein